MKLQIEFEVEESPLLRIISYGYRALVPETDKSFNNPVKIDVPTDKFQVEPVLSQMT